MKKSTPFCIVLCIQTICISGNDNQKMMLQALQKSPDKQQAHAQIKPPAVMGKVMELCKKYRMNVSSQDIKHILGWKQVKEEEGIDDAPAAYAQEMQDLLRKKAEKVSDVIHPDMTAWQKFCNKKNIQKQRSPLRLFFRIDRWKTERLENVVVGGLMGLVATGLISKYIHNRLKTATGEDA